MVKHLVLVATPVSPTAALVDNMMNHDISNPNRIRIAAAIAFLACVNIAYARQGTEALARDYPNRPIRVLVGNAPGGATDILARAVGQKLTERCRR